MNNPQYINNVTLNGAVDGTQPSDLNPGQPGVDFTSTDASITISFPSDITPILVSVSVPNTNTNVVEIIVVITAPNGTVLFNQTSPSGTNSVTGFPVEPLPEGSILTVIPVTADESAPQNVTLSVIACYTPSTGTTIVSTGTTPPVITGATSTIIVSSETTEVPTGSTESTSFATTATGSSATGYTTTIICPSVEGMNNPQYIDTVTIIGAVDEAEPSDLNPGSSGVDFTSPNASVTISFPSDVTPIIVNVSVPNTNTNVVEIIVVITAPNGTVLFNQTSPSGTNSVTGFPVEPLPEGSTLTVIPVAADESAPQNVTLSVIACYTPSTATTIVSTGTTPPVVTGETSTIIVSSETTEVPTGSTESTTFTTTATGSSAAGYTTTVICPSVEGMNNPQYINNVTIIGAVDEAEPSDLNPGQPGVDFTSTDASITISFPSDITPILVSVSVPNTNTNVVEIIVVITAPNGTVLFNQTSPSGTNSVTGFPVEPLPEGSTLTVTPITSDGSAPQNVTLSVIACYTPSTATTIVTTGTIPPTVTGSTEIVISSSTTELVTGTGNFQKYFSIDIIVAQLYG